MAITRTGIIVSENSTFGDADDMDFSREGGSLGQQSIQATGLTPETYYWTKAYIVRDGVTIESSVSEFRTYHSFEVDMVTLQNEYAGDNTFTLTKNGTPRSSDLEYSIDEGQNWVAFDLAQTTNTVTVEGGKKIQLRSSTGFSAGANGYFQISMSHSYSAMGNLMSLIDYTDMSNASQYTGDWYGMFYGDSNIVSVADLIFPNVTTSNCCSRMFLGCTGLTTPPRELPADIVYSSYYGMFQGCTSLTSVPYILASSIDTVGCCQMFKGCTSLTSVPTNMMPNLTTVDDNGLESMFSGCTGLTNMPNLTATSLGEKSYRMMFYGCTSLTTTSSISVTTAGDYCFDNMFQGCVALTTTPSIDVTTAGVHCFNEMFKGCTALTLVSEISIDNAGDYCLLYCFDGCSAIEEVYEFNVNYADVQSCRGVFLDCVNLIRVRNGQIKNLIGDECVWEMFRGCTSLREVPSDMLPATTLTIECYYGMFRGCTSLTSAPILPATTLAKGCYNKMFYGCTSLTASPILPATTLVDSCYYNLFYNCSSLAEITCLATNVSATSCKNNWVYRVASTGRFYKNPEMLESTWGTGASGIPSNWAVGDYSE